MQIEDEHMKYKITYNIKPEDFESIRASVGWNKLPYNQIDLAIKNSMINVSIFDENLCVGVGRIVGDHILKGMLTDVMVRKEYQGKGVGKLIVNKLISKLYNSISEGESFQLEASPTTNNREFYIKCGLKYKPENQDGVYMWIRK